MTIWSIYEIEDFKAIPFENVRQLRYQGHSLDLSGPQTWLDLWRAANKLVQRSGDHHHIFIESVTQNGDVLELRAGS